MKDINNQLERYWNGTSSIEDERNLKSYFNSQDIADEHKEYRGLFTYLDKETSVQLPETFKWDTSLIEAPTKIRRIVPMIRTMAAVLILALAGIFLINNNLDTPSKGAEVVTIDDPEEALAYTKKALAMLSKNYSKGTTQISTNIGEAKRLQIIK